MLVKINTHLGKKISYYLRNENYSIRVLTEIFSIHLNIVFIYRHSEPLPDVQTLTYLLNYYTDGIPLHWAVVDNGDIAFYDFTHIDIPVIL